MTEPTPADAAKAAEATRAAEARKAPKLTVGDVVEYRHRDLVLGGEKRTATGVVVAVRDGAVSIVPLSHHHLEVDPADVRPLSADDLDA
jgi:hypothetical protein